MLIVSVVGLAVVANAVIIYLLLRHNAKSTTNQLIAILSLISILWAIFNYLPYTTPDVQMRLLYVRSVMFVTAPFGLLIFLLALVYPKTKLSISNRRKKIVLQIFILLSIITALLSFSSLMFSGLSNNSDGSFELNTGIGLVFYASVNVSLMIGGFIVLIRKLKQSQGVEKEQLRYFLLGLILSFSLMAITNLLAVLVLKTTSYTTIGPAFTVIFVGSIAYSIIRHRFLNISHFASRTIAYIFIVVSIMLIYAALLNGIGLLITGKLNSIFDLIPGLLAAILIGFSFPYIEKQLVQRSEKLLYRDWYDLNKAIYEIVTSLTSTLDLDVLIKLVLDDLASFVHPHQIALIDLKKCLIWVNNGQAHLTKEQSNDILTFFQKKDDLIVLSNFHIQIKNLERISLAVPLKTEVGIEGVLIVGEKLSGDIYSKRDLDLFSIVGPQIALAIQNARSYEEIRNFNITLKEEVEHATKKLKAANARLLQLDKLKDEFVSLASHELRTPMVSIRNYTWMLLNGKAGPLKPKQKEYIHRVYESGTRLSRLVNSMLNISRIESGRIILNVERADIYEVVKSVLTEIEGKAKSQSIKIVVEQSIKDLKTKRELEKPPSVLIDIDKIKEVIINLVGNSMKFTKPGGKIIVSFAVDELYVHVMVKDDGIGLTEEEIPQLFKKFGMIKETYLMTTGTVQGTGLGLYICKSIIDMHGGSIGVMSEGRQKGSTFSFTVPREASPVASKIQRGDSESKDAGIIHTELNGY